LNAESKILNPKLHFLNPTPVKPEDATGGGEVGGIHGAGETPNA